MNNSSLLKDTHNKIVGKNNNHNRKLNNNKNIKLILKDNNKNNFVRILPKRSN
eukprot:UN00221